MRGLFEKRIVFVLLAAICLFGCVETKTLVKSDVPVANIEVQKVDEVLPNIDISGAKENSIVVNTRFLAEDKVAIDFLAYKINVEPVFGTAINLSYDSGILEYVSYKRGNFLEQAGEDIGVSKPTYMISTTDAPASSAQAGNTAAKGLIIGATLFRGTPGVIGTGRLISLLFNIQPKTATQLFFSKKKLKNLKAGDISGIIWPDKIIIGKESVLEGS